MNRKSSYQFAILTGCIVGALCGGGASVVAHLSARTPATENYTDSMSDTALPENASADLTIENLHNGQEISEHFEPCSPSANVNCVDDGGTLWIKGKKARLSGLSAPVRDTADCYDERKLADESAEELLKAINKGAFRLKIDDGGGEAPMDEQGRYLVTLTRSGIPLTDALVTKGLLKPRPASGVDWCKQ